MSRSWTSSTRRTKSPDGPEYCRRYPRVQANLRLRDLSSYLYRSILSMPRPAISGRPGGHETASPSGKQTSRIRGRGLKSELARSIHFVECYSHTWTRNQTAQSAPARRSLPIANSGDWSRASALRSFNRRPNVAPSSRSPPPTHLADSSLNGNVTVADMLKAVTMIWLVEAFRIARNYRNATMLAGRSAI